MFASVVQSPTWMPHVWPPVRPGDWSRFVWMLIEAGPGELDVARS
jgi:hypothetical protein